LGHWSGLLAAKEIVQHFDELDFERSQARAGQPDKCVQVRPADRLDREARSPARAQPAERIPDVAELVRQWRRLELGLELGELVGPSRPLEQPLEDLPVRDAILERRELEGLFGERPQLVAEG
jgi:hypothetical protein